jgi:hypothetical protein
MVEEAKTLGLKSSRFESKNISSRAEEVCDKAKKKHRSDIKLRDWSKYNYYKSNWTERMLKEPLKGMCEIPYEDSNNLTVEEFREKYEKLNKPVILTNITKKWKAAKAWNHEVKLSNEGALPKV